MCEKNAMIQIASNINNYFQLPAVVVYNPNFFSGDQFQLPEQANGFKFGYYYGDYSRTYVQSKYVNSDWKRQSVRDIDRMPDCTCDTTGNDSPNYYRCLMTCISENFTSNMLEPKIAIVVRDITKKSSKMVGENYVVEIDLHVKVLGLELADAVIVDEFLKGVGSADNEQTAYENAIKNAMDANIDDLMFEESKVYYDYSTNGREVSIEVPYTVCKTVFEFKTFKNQLADNCLIRLDETTEDNSRFIRVLTTEARQSLVVDKVLNVLIQAGFQSRVSDIKPYAHIIKIEGK